MSNVIIRFKPDRTELNKSLATIDKEFKTFIDQKKEDVNTQVDLVGQDVTNLIRDTKLIKRVSAQQNSELIVQTRQLEHLKTLQDGMEKDMVGATLEYRELTAKIRSTQEEIDKLNAKIEVVNAKSKEALGNMQKASALVGATLGFLSLITAVTDNAQNEMLSFVLAIFSSGISTATAYATLGAASGNWAMVAAAGSMAASTASIINVLKAVGRRRQQQQAMDKRRLQQRKV